MRYAGKKQRTYAGNFNKSAGNDIEYTADQ